MEEAKLLLARVQEARNNLEAEAKRASTLTPALQKAIQDARVTMSDAMTVLVHFRQISDQLIVAEPGAEVTMR
ncbi:MAG TPA: hypothetical protein VFM05_08230 [Candidatus Saccharimonadales bacterium]|nr:hypothetical protein [Candidatus Saccharimonadales bacterium]